MAKYTISQARKKAEMVVDQFGSHILAAAKGTGVDPAFIAGKIGVEAGVSGGKIRAGATRYEAGVFADLKSLRDHGFCHVGGKKMTSYSGVKRSQIADADDAALKALATSYGLTQIMGWHMINNLKGTIADLRDPEKHLRYNAQLLKIVGGSYITSKNYEAVLRIWNTGRPTGKTYDPNYVHNALLVMEQAKPLLKNVKAAKPVNLASIIDQADDPETDPDTPAAPEPAMQQADQITNINQAPTAENQPPKNQPTDVPMDAPAPENLKEKLKSWFNWLVAFLFPTGVLAAIKSAQEDGTIKVSEILGILLQIFYFVFPYLAVFGGLYVFYRIIKMILIQISFIFRMRINGNPDLNNINLKPAAAPETQKPETWWKIW